MKKLRFNELPLSGHILSAVAEMGFEEASPIQSETIPVILEGKDVIGQAQTGTGKTAAFAIPAIEKLEPGSRSLQVLVLCPTRELVMQVTEEFRKLMKFMGSVSDASIVAVYGGQEIDRQFKALRKKPLIVVGTPGRMMDHMRRKSIDLSSITMVVLDEADEMLDMGFRDDIEYILSETSPERQTIMFSATMSKDILALTHRYQNSPVVIDVTSQKINAPIIDQMYFEIPERAKPEAVARLIDFYNINLALVFCNTKSKVDDLVEVLKTRGYFAEGLHGDMLQKQREKVMGGFRSGIVEILVATDVAGRGIDVNDIAAVFNYDLPRDDEDYIHRIGRTGRAGKSGKSFTFVTGRELNNMRRIERTNGVKITRGTIPSIDDLDSTMIKSYGDKIRALIEKGELSRYTRIVEGLLGDEFTSIDVAAVLLKLAMEGKSEGYDDTQVFNITSGSGRYQKSDPRDRERDRDGGRSYGGDREKKYSRSGGKPKGRDNSRGRTVSDRTPFHSRESGSERAPGGRSSGGRYPRTTDDRNIGGGSGHASGGRAAGDRYPRSADRDSTPGNRESAPGKRDRYPRSTEKAPKSSDGDRSNEPSSGGDHWWSTFDKNAGAGKSAADKKKKPRKKD